MITFVPFEYCTHFLQIVASFLTTPVGVLFVGVIVSSLIVSLFNNLRR